MAGKWWKRMALMVAGLVVLTAACGGDDDSADDGTGSQAVDEPTATATAESQSTEPEDIDFQATAEAFVTAAATADCGAAADIQKYTEPGRNRDVSNRELRAHRRRAGHFRRARLGKHA